VNAVIVAYEGKYSGGGGFVIVGVTIQYAVYRYYLWQAKKKQENEAL